ncbi:phosphopantetheine-binding protein [Kitasatospora sp. NBC_00240]|uniref:phosphopantetheine-binding protein n=1 Tax=Kitasatospora sp. NBC_00240 TaxID=2903567 RepID=UPI00224CB666|nr:phosphopantetheine-binding protein [Kitasatospora sp. NBC_00240]MCX5208629.1 phosphopantetheine-binding protein [Kitasatospora sp. NBC_00240]
MSDTDGLRELITVAGDELGLDIAPQDATVDFDELPGWDSLHLLTLLTALERVTGRRLSLPDLLEARTIAEVFEIASAQPAA